MSPSPDSMGDMTDGTDLDTLIIGQGLAGSLLARELLRCGERLLVVDNNHANASSTVAAGLINPITGKRLVKSVGVDHCLPHALALYHELERELGRPLLHARPMLRLFGDDAQREQWQTRRHQQGYAPYMGEVFSAEQLPHGICPGHGAGLQLQTYYLDTLPLLLGLRQQLQQRGAYLCDEFAPDALQWREEGIFWCDRRVGRVIFCEGYRAMDNPWFSWLPFQPAKGEFLSLQSETPLPDVIINNGGWLMPREEGHYRLGASYDHRRLDSEPTEAAREQLLAMLPRLLCPAPSMQVSAQQAGVRPTTSDRQPFLGVHPRHPGLYIFNGFGSKGSLLIPWHVQLMCRYLLQDEALPPDVDVARYRDSCGD